MKQISKNESEVLGAIIKMQEQISALDKKVDALMMRALMGIVLSIVKNVFLLIAKQ